MKILWTDFESRGVVELRGQKSVGLHNYMFHPQTELMIMGYKLPGSGLYQSHEFRFGKLPEEVDDALRNPKVFVGSYNSAFERYGLLKIGYDIPASRFIDPQIGVRVLALPPDLATACTVLGLPEEMAKFERGEELIQLFSKPKMTRKKKGEERRQYFNDWESHPAEWQEFVQYCVRDVVAEEEVYRRLLLLGALPLSEFEHKVWVFDQKVNDRGMPVDIAFVQRALKIAQQAKTEALDAQNKLTGLQNSNSTQQLLPWVRERGYPYNTLNKNFVDAVLKDPEVNITDLCREVLKARRISGSNSYTKLAKILLLVSPDNRLRNQFIYLGSSRCGRWSGNGVQLHNLPRPSKPKDVNGYDFEERDVIGEARRMVMNEDYDGIKKKYGNVLEVIKSLLRTSFSAEWA